MAALQNNARLLGHRHTDFLSTLLRRLNPHDGSFEPYKLPSVGPLLAVFDLRWSFPARVAYHHTPLLTITHPNFQPDTHQTHRPTTATISAPCSSSQGNFHPLHRVLSIGKPLSTPTPTPVAATSQHDLQQLVRLEGTAKASEIESGRLPAMDMAPFAGDENEQSTKELRGRTKEWLINNFIRADPEVKDAMGRVIASRRRSGAPAGARAS